MFCDFIRPSKPQAQIELESNSRPMSKIYVSLTISHLVKGCSSTTAQSHRLAHTLFRSIPGGQAPMHVIGMATKVFIIGKYLSYSQSAWQHMCVCFPIFRDGLIEADSSLAPYSTSRTTICSRHWVGICPCIGLPSSRKSGHSPALLDNFP